MHVGQSVINQRYYAKLNSWKPICGTDIQATSPRVSGSLKLLARR